MKLVEILARELKEWPEGVLKIVQNYSYNLEGYGEDCGEVDQETNFWNGQDFTGFRLRARCLASDRNTAIVTRAEWKAELARLHSELSFNPANKPNKDGWIRHRGGKCPVEAGVLVEVRLRDGHIYQGDESSPGECWDWSNEGVSGDIMAYRLHKPAEQPVIEPAVLANVQAFNERAEMRDDSKVVLGPQPIKWRDRITEIDASVEALEEERASLVQRLEDEGFRLIERAAQPVEDMSDWRNWNEGDLVKCVSFKGKGFARLTIGKLYEYDGKGCIVDDDGDSQGLPVIEGTALQFHSRPSK